MQHQKRRRGSRKPKWMKTIALERIKILFDEAEKAAKHGDYKFADRYVDIARRISMKYNVRIPKDLKRKYCKYCYRYLVPGVNCSVRVNSKLKAVEVKCLSCNNTMRYPIVKKAFK